MAVNKNALVRYKVLDRCFRNLGKRYFIEDLMEECSAILSEISPLPNSISRRQIFEDMTFMESKAGWSIELERRREGRRVYYRYSDPSFSIDKMPLNELEINELESASLILSQFRGMPQFEWLNELLPKLGQEMAAKDAAPAIIGFDNNPYLKGIEHLEALSNAVLYKSVLKIDYQPYEDDVPFEVEIHPYFLKQYNNRWFLFGYNPANRRYNWNLAMDRIVKIREIGGKYHKNTEIDWEQYFDDIIGVTRPEHGIVEEVVLRFYGRTSRYIEAKPLHGSQRSKWLNDLTLEVKLKVMLNYELEREILSYANNVKVITPAKLADNIRSRLSEALNNY